MTDIANVEQLFLELTPVPWKQRTQTHSQHFDTSHASISLSPYLAATFSLGGKRLCYTELAQLQLSIKQAWDLGAQNTIRVATRPQGICFSHRPSSYLSSRATTGIQIRAHGSAIGSWLAHPLSFSILDKHFSQLLGAPLAYYAPDNSMLLAEPIPQPGHHSSLSTWITEHFCAHHPHRIPPVFYCAQGFPTHVLPQHAQCAISVG
ncbi:hypothetical protein EML15_02010 [Corynebacterium sp. sy017]|uniref:hypothetical protein n=1 Tax=unclassified Corynebacterium TaxID=2624378 RepID=UPI0011849B3A|nr:MULTISPECIES: hypothetical protein [unclassified Corynebacterium]MBP3087932.1 hypothetical protein [Corynebacterium sp. sy017]TSD92469.1 hypothetical protein ELY17_02010 [Corynebacterium sp. SY003]